jgi:cytochrome d ubiquinol oxidase subunit II
VNRANAVLVFLWVGVTAYAVLAGADFGGGVWDLLAGGTQRGARQRRRIAASIGPVWEANHVWLIFALVILWTAFPPVFAAIASTLYIPLTVVAFGVIVRGSSFALRKASPELHVKRRFGAGFALSSLVTPFFLGTIAGAMASGRVPPGDAAGDVLRSWTGPTSVLGGLLAVGGCAYLAAAYLVADARRNGEFDLVEIFRRRALQAGLFCGFTVLAGIEVLRVDAPTLWSGLLGRAFPLVLASAAASTTSLVLLWRRRYVGTRLTAALGVITILWAWAAAQYPHLLVGSFTVGQAAAAPATLTALIAVMAVGSVLLLPSLGLLFAVARQSHPLDARPDGSTWDVAPSANAGDDGSHAA